MYESIDKITKLENEVLEKDGMEIMSENAQYKRTVDGMAKHIVYGNIISVNLHYSTNSINIALFFFFKKYVFFRFINN